MTNPTKAGYLACAIAAALGSTPALAVAPPNLGGPAAPAGVFYYGGGSAEPQAIGVATCNLMSNVDLYTSTAGGGAPSAYYILYGNLKAATGSLPSGAAVMVMYKFNGGSYANGAIPQQAGGPTPLQYPAVSAVLAAADAAVPNPPGTGLGTFCTPGNGVPTVQFPSLGTLANQNPDFGLTDLEASAFVGAENNPNYPAATVKVGSATPIYDLIFGIAVTSQLYAQKTNWTHAEVAAVLSGAVQDWSQLQGDNGVVLPAGAIILIDRNVGSGTKASSNSEFLGFPGLGSNALSPNSLTGTGYTGGAGGGAPPVNCGAAYQDIQDTSSAGVVKDLKTAAGCGLRALGLLSMDNPPGIAANQNVAGTNAYDFVSLNGVAVDTGTAGDNINGQAPGTTSYVNAVKGNYTDFYQANFNQSTANGAGLPANNAALATAYKLQLQSPTLPGCSGNPGLKFPGNLPGVMTDGDTQSTFAPNVCVGVTTRGGVSDALLFPALLPGNVLLGKDPI